MKRNKQEIITLQDASCPITLFVQFKKGDKRRYRGDKYVDSIPEMIMGLYKFAKGIRRRTYTMIIYDNRKDESNNIIVKWNNGVVVYDITAEYGISNIELITMYIQ